MENESKVGLTTQERSSEVFSKYDCEGYPVSFIVVLDRSGKDIILSFHIIRLRKKKSIVIKKALLLGIVFVKSDENSYL